MEFIRKKKQLKKQPETESDSEDADQTVVEAPIQDDAVDQILGDRCYITEDLTPFRYKIYNYLYVQNEEKKFYKQRYTKNGNIIIVDLQDKTHTYYRILKSFTKSV